MLSLSSAATPSAPPTSAAAAPATCSRPKTRKPLAKPKRLPAAVATRQPRPLTRKTRTTCICITCCTRRGHIMVEVTRRIRRIRRRRRRPSARDMVSRRMRRASRRTWGGRRRGGISCLGRRTGLTRRRRRGRGVRRGRVGIVRRKGVGWVVVRLKRGIQLEGDPPSRPLLRTADIYGCPLGYEKWVVFFLFGSSHCSYPGVLALREIHLSTRGWRWVGYGLSWQVGAFLLQH